MNVKNCEILTRGEADFNLSNLDGYAVIPMEVFRSMGGSDHPAYADGIVRAFTAMQSSLKAGADQKAAERAYLSCPFGDE